MSTQPREGPDHHVGWKIKELRTFGGTTGGPFWLLLNILPSLVWRSACIILSAASAGTFSKNSIQRSAGRSGIGKGWGLGRLVTHRHRIGRGMSALGDVEPLPIGWLHCEMQCFLSFLEPWDSSSRESCQGSHRHLDVEGRCCALQLAPRKRPAFGQQRGLWAYKQPYGGWVYSKRASDP